MRTIDRTEVGEKLIALLEEETPVDEDIGIVDKRGIAVAVVISMDAYQFFLRKVEEEENKVDSQTVNAFRNLEEENREG